MNQQDTDPTGPSWRPALLGRRHDAGRVTCELCPHGCDLGDGQVGLCRVRRNRGCGLETATFAVAVAYLDAIERKPLYHVRPGTRVLTTAAPGCTFRCGYCINHRLSQYGRTGAPGWVGEPARPADLVARAAAEHAAIGLSYTEPGLAPELTLALAEHAAPAGVPLVWKSNGFLTAKAIDLVAPVLDAVNIDVKAADDPAHRRLTGAPLGPVLAAIERFRAAGVWVEVSTPLIPGTSTDPARSTCRSDTGPDHCCRPRPGRRCSGRIRAPRSCSRPGPPWPFPWTVGSRPGPCGPGRHPRWTASYPAPPSPRWPPPTPRPPRRPRPHRPTSPARPAGLAGHRPGQAGPGRAGREPGATTPSMPRWPRTWCRPPNSTKRTANSSAPHTSMSAPHTRQVARVDRDGVGAGAYAVGRGGRRATTVISRPRPAC